MKRTNKTQSLVKEKRDSLQEYYSNQESLTIDLVKPEDRKQKVFDEIWLRRAIDSGHKFDESREIARADSTERVLTSMYVHPHQYENVYNIATKIHNEQDVSPFNIDTIVKAAEVLKFRATKKNLYWFAEENDCESCYDTGMLLEELVPVKENGETIDCPECKGANRRESNTDDSFGFSF